MSKLLFGHAKTIGGHIFSGHASSGTAFSPASLFSGAQQGLWADPSDLTTTWQDAAATTAAGIGDPVARIDDKSGNGNFFSTATLGDRPVLTQDGSGNIYLAFDGIDDGLQTPAAVDFSAGDELLLIAGVKCDVSETSVIFELGASSSSAGGFGLFQTAGPGLNLRSTGSSSSTASYGQGTSLGVVSGQSKISTDQNILRTNGVQRSAPATDQGAGNYANAVVYLGGREASSLSFEGRVYGVILRAGLPTTAELASAEAWMNGKTGAF